MKICITGANGFVGRRLYRTIVEKTDHTPQAVVRNNSVFTDLNASKVFSIGPDTDWSEILRGQDLVIHCAALTTGTNATEYEQVNVLGTLNLASQAVTSGVKRFIFISSIKVCGEVTYERPFKFSDSPGPKDLYGQSKYKAEQGLLQISADTSMEVVIIRPPVVYGEGVKGNFRLLERLLATSLPLPFGSVSNQRSFCALHNLVDLILVCIDHPRAGNQIFLVSDDEDLSTKELVSKLGRAINKPARMFPCPVELLKIILKFIAKPEVAGRLFENLQLDISHTKNTLDWHPPISVDNGLSELKN